MVLGHQQNSLHFEGKLVVPRCENSTRHEAAQDDAIRWKHFPRYWPFVRGIHRAPVNSTHKGHWRGALMFSLIFAWIQLSKQSWGWWFETPPRPLWRHCNVASSIKSLWGERFRIPHHTCRIGVIELRLGNLTVLPIMSSPSNPRADS